MGMSFDNKKANDSNISSNSGSPPPKSLLNSFCSFFSFDSLPNGIFAISLFGLFLGASTTIIYSQLGLFLKNVLHASEAKIAFLDGFVEFLAYIVRVFSGIIIDYFRNRKVVLIVGCVITLCMKPLFAIAKSTMMVLFAQSVERIGNGLQAVPRDAWISDLSDKHTNGRSFGFSKSLKTLGALFGTCAAILLMWLTNNNYRIVFFCAAIPAAIAILCLLKVKSGNIKEEKLGQNQKTENPFKKRYLKSLNTSFWKLISLACIFELGHFSDAMLPVYGNKFLSVTTAGSVSLFISLGQVLLSYPIGLYADKFNKRCFIRVCIIIMMISNTFLLMAESITSVFIGAFLWGGQMSAIQGLFLSLIGERVNPHLRGTAIGIYYCVIGIAYLLASTIAGNIWTSFGASYSFMYSIFICGISLIVFNLLLPSKKNETEK